ncbi:MAG: hypothetical protein ACT6UH_00545 [Hydrogenophaga sp.]|uniref:hypothetical protein n=1 Tax=Hydrogenophaga sp. TaxID=1904254 RepID=UPI0040364199
MAFPVLALPKIEMLFADGSRAWLYQVGTDWLIRSVDHLGESLSVDLREMVAGIEADINEAAEHDRAGIIFFELRRRFKTACAFFQAVQDLQPASQRLVA